MKLGIVGLPNVGKSTLFNAITEAGAEVANYPFCTIEPNVGVVKVPDHRIDTLHKVFNSKRTVYATIEFSDIAGLVAGASKGEGLGNKFLGHIREVAAIVHVVRAFDDDNIVHVNGKIDPLSDIETINTELILADMEFLENQIAKAKKRVKHDPGIKKELSVMSAVYDFIAGGKSARAMDLSEDEEAIVKDLKLLSYKPVIYAINVSEEYAAEGASNEYIDEVREFAHTESAESVVISAEIEQELAALDPSEKKEYLQAIGVKESGLDKLIKASYKLLNQISFLTAGEDECRAWTISRGTKAPQAAGKIHTDFEKGFIRAETISYDKLMEVGGSLVKAKEKGWIRSEGKDYTVQDGDVINFLFNV